MSEISSKQEDVHVGVGVLLDTGSTPVSSTRSTRIGDCSPNCISTCTGHAGRYKQQQASVPSYGGKYYEHITLDLVQTKK